MNTRRNFQLLSLSTVTAVLVVVTVGRAEAPSGRYTITDSTVDDGQTHLTWQRKEAPTRMSWANAKSYCLGLSLSGVGWRLPSMKELQTIVDRGRSNPAIDPTAFPNTSSDWFWTSSPIAAYYGGEDDSPDAWVVKFNNGGSQNDNAIFLNRVRCVR